MRNIFNRNFTRILSLTFVIILFSCEKNDITNEDDITGTYLGTLSILTSDGSNNIVTNISATAEIQLMENQIQVHCYAQDFDETILLDTFQDNGYIRVCLTGEEFENMYGHGYEHGNMCNGNGPHGDDDWASHLNNHHQDGDDHLGYFDMATHTFHYIFQLSDGDYQFQGTNN